MENLKINYDALNIQRQAELQKDLSQELSRHMDPGSGGRIDSLRRHVLQKVVASDYKMAQEELKRYIDQLSEYPNFFFRTARHVRHCADLINAIKAKRNFPGLHTLSRSKQQELTERVIDHFDELKEYLKKIEQIERDIKLEDMRSTVWFVKSVFYSAFVVLIVAFLLELFGGLSGTFVIVMNDLVDKIQNYVFNLL